MGDQADVVDQVLTQLREIYSPENLAKDAFFKEMTEQDPEGWISLKRFGAIKRFKNVIDGNLDYLIQAAERSNGVFLINEDKTKLRKVPEEVLEKEKKEAQAETKKQEFMDYISSQNARSIYAKGFATDADKDEIKQLFAQFGRVLRLKMRMDDDKKFKGSVFVEFETNEIAEKVATKEDLKFGDSPLQLMMKQAYIDMKAQEKYSGQEWQGRDHSNKSLKHLVEYEGAKDKSFKEIKELVRTKAEVYCVEPLEGEGRGVVQLANMSAEAFLNSLEDNKLGDLTFRLTDESSERQFRAARANHDKNHRGTKRKQGGGRGGRGGNRGRGGGRGGRGDKRQRTENSSPAAAAKTAPPVIESSS